MMGWPEAQVLNYGQGVFEGLKAFETPKGQACLFRPRENARRMARSAERMAMPAISEATFMDGIEQTALENKDCIPPCGKGSLYLRPLLIGSGERLGLAPAGQYTFIVFCSPVSAYFQSGQFTPIELGVEPFYRRASPGGTGGSKVIGNYSPVLLSQLRAKEEGYADVVYLDAQKGRNVEEVSSCNIFAVMGDNSIVTPPVGTTVLPGITRDSVIQLARRRGYRVEERELSIEELLGASEVFTTGTAVQVVPVGGITHNQERREFPTSQTAQMLYDDLVSAQSDALDDPLGWLYPLA